MWNGNTYTDDDGSTIVLGDNGSFWSTPAPDSYFTNMPSANWSPSSVNPAANSWGDVLKFGLARVIDAKTRPMYLENTLPLYQQQQQLAQQQSSMLFWLIIAGVAVYALA
ncbi:MAG TPA: hypothetical protein VED01_07780 [Burkholderiales bacterium]|nr:hypothetical protein [Burkholderiales bacterium]